MSRLCRVIVEGARDFQTTFSKNHANSHVNLSFGREIFAEYSRNDYQWCLPFTLNTRTRVWSCIRLRRIEIRPRWRYRDPARSIHGQVERTANVEILGSRRNGMRAGAAASRTPSWNFLLSSSRGRRCYMRLEKSSNETYVSNGRNKLRNFETYFLTSYLTFEI